MNIAQKIRELVGRSDTGEALELLELLSEGHNSNNDVILLKARYSQYKKEKLLNLNNDNQGFLSINLAILTIAEAIEEVKKGAEPSEHLPNIITFEDYKDGKYTLHYADANSERIMNALTSKYFGELYVEDDDVELWRAKNPYGFIILYNKYNHPCGDITVLGLEKNFMDSLIKGKVSDVEITPDKILSFEETKNCDSLYVTGIIVAEPFTSIGRKRALALIWGTIQYLKKYYISNPKKKIYAVAITKESENILKKFGFQLEGIGSRRADHHDLYSLIIDKKNLQRVINRLGDYSSICKIQI